jgi:hypothetical protein
MDLWQKIQSHVKTMIVKYWDIVMNRDNLPEVGPKDTVQSHQRAYDGYRKGYGNMADEFYSDRCPGGPPPLDPPYDKTPSWDKVKYPPGYSPSTGDARLGLLVLVLYGLYRATRQAAACAPVQPGVLVTCVLSGVAP